MKETDFVELINDNEELRSKNIRKGIHGVLVSYISASDEWIVRFFDDYNYGEYAVAKAKTADLRYSSDMPDSWKKGAIAISERKDFYTHTELRPPKFKEFDKVMLIRDKECYAKEGVRKGMTGCVMFDHAYGSKWDVIFSEDGTARDIAEINVHEDDIEVVD